ncbi:MAG TPA: oligosaccharide flippase family protein [Solirubrobacterales bacterium]|jgi:O-antigen/teichoic acid export membrane protein|nr:oligosaccharide flippase family protein [Solirubrobacterales bacterium]
MLFRNTLAQSSSFALGYLFSFLLAPLMIARLGLDAFGVWAVTGAFATYAGLLDLGVGRSLARFIAVYDAEGDDRRIGECVGLGLLIVFVVGVLTAALAVAAAPLLSDSLGVLDSDEMRIVLVASVLIWTFNGADGVFNAVGIGKQQMVPPNVATAIGVTINFALSLVALALSSALTLYAGANGIAALLGLIPSAIAMRHVWGGPYVVIPSRSLIREVIGFSLKNQITWFADLVNLQTDKLIIALMVDIRAAAVYEIGSRVVAAVRSAAVMSVSAMIPTAAARIVEEGRGVIRPMYRRYTSLTCATAFPLFMLATVSSPFLLVAWLGSVPSEAGIVVPILSVAYLVNITTGVGTTIAIGAGHPGLAATNSVQIAVANVILTVALAPLFGLWGVVVGTAIAIVFGSLSFNRRFLRMFGLPRRDFWDGVLPAAGYAFAPAVPAGLLAVLAGVPDSRLQAVPLLLLSVVLYAPPYWWLASRRGLLPERLSLRWAHRRPAPAP